ncbi:MAG TPA: hypothetical protein VI338_07155 [Nitrososphaera sp.]|nr:hypothetical protein [Nitrososphaera sp.]
MSTYISTLANYDFDAIIIYAVRSVIVIGDSKYSTAFRTFSWKSFHDPFSSNSIFHNVLHVGITTKAAIVEKSFNLNLASMSSAGSSTMPSF